MPYTAAGGAIASSAVSEDASVWRSIIEEPVNCLRYFESSLDRRLDRVCEIVVLGANEAEIDQGKAVQEHLARNSVVEQAERGARKSAALRRETWVVDRADGDWYFSVLRQTCQHGGKISSEVFPDCG